MSETPVVPKDIIGMSTYDLIAEIIRLRSLLEDLVRAVEPFVRDARDIRRLRQSIMVDEDVFIGTSGLHHLEQSWQRYLSLEEAYLKAKGE